MNVVSYYDGMSCGQIALDKLGVKVDNYFAFEMGLIVLFISVKAIFFVFFLRCMFFVEVFIIDLTIK